MAKHEQVLQQKDFRSKFCSYDKYTVLISK